MDGGRRDHGRNLTSGATRDVSTACILAPISGSVEYVDMSSWAKTARESVIGSISHPIKNECRWLPSHPFWCSHVCIPVEENNRHSLLRSYYLRVYPESDQTLEKKGWNSHPTQIGANIFIFYQEMRHFFLFFIVIYILSTWFDVHILITILLQLYDIKANDFNFNFDLNYLIHFFLKSLSFSSHYLLLFFFNLFIHEVLLFF